MRRRTAPPPPSAETIRVVMVESRALLGVGVREVLDQASDIEVVAQVRSPDEALPIVEQASPDVILVNVPAAESAATDAARRLHLGSPDTALVVLGGEDNDASLVGAIEIGATGHVAEDAEPHQLVATIRAAADGEDPIKAELTARPDLVERIVDDVRDAILADRRPSNPLTPRELEVLRLVADGCRNREIAEGLGLSEQTVKNHMTSTLHKLGVPSRGAAVRYGVRQGWLTLAVNAEVAVAFDPPGELV